MQVPEAFRYLARCFHQDMFLRASTEAGIVVNALRCLRPDEQLAVKQFLTELLSGDADGPEIQRLWNDAAPDWGFPDDRDLRLFLAMIRDMAGGPAVGG